MKVYTVADHIVSPLGSGTSLNFSELEKGKSGVARHFNNRIFPEPVYAGILDREELTFDLLERYTFLENLLIHSIGKVLGEVHIPDRKRCVLVLSTTKGNIDLLAENQEDRVERNAVMLPVLAERINAYFNFPHPPITVSNACISGVSAILTAKKLIQAGLYDHAVVSGVDIITEFVLSGFHSFMALSDKPCKPYDSDRKGINIGEACGTVILSNAPELCKEKNSFSEVAGGGQSNDANHISGPSRTGDGLVIAIRKALAEAELSMDQIDYINAHGTATLYNDEMEAQALDQLKANKIPLNSLKGYYGHTLGASGTVESIISIWQMNSNLLIRSLGFEKPGITKSLNVLDKNLKQDVNTVLKTSSGFGGCNGAIIFRKP